MKKLKRVTEDKFLGGVCCGLGKHFDIDPVIFRLIFLLTIPSIFPSITLYLLMWVLLPKEEVIS
jgi:phage shock protein PspC (stress-responsive transcriptional regulator)